MGSPHGCGGGEGQEAAAQRAAGSATDKQTKNSRQQLVQKILVSVVVQAYKDATYGEGFTADIDPKGAKKAGPKRKAAELDDAEKELASEVHSISASCQRCYTSIHSYI